MLLRCRLGFHRWPVNATTRWVEGHAPSLAKNRLGLAMEYRACERCGRVGDVSTWFDAPDSDYGFPRITGPFTSRRIREVLAGPRKALPAPPLPFPWENDGVV